MGAPRMAICFVSVGLLAGIVNADVIYKTNGGKVEGDIVDGETTATHVTIKSRFGKFKFSRNEIKDIEFTQTPAETYKEVAKKYKETAEDQFKLALWLLDNRYRDEYLTTLEKVIALDPEHKEARQRLGHSKQDGKWMTRDEAMASRGYVKHKGKWVLPQEKELAQQKSAAKEAQQEFFRQIRVWQKWLRQPDENRQSEATAALLKIRDPAAVKPLVDILGDRGNDNERRLLVDVLKEISGHESTAGLALVAMNDKVEANRSAAVELLVDRKTPKLVHDIAVYLKNNDNQKVRNAAAFLEKVGDPSVVPALVDALVTTHKHVVETSLMDQAKAAGGYQFKPRSTYILPNGAIIRPSNVNPYSMQGGVMAGPAPAAQVFIEEQRNVEALKALVAITGQDFGYNKARWGAWIRENYRDKAAKLTN